MTRRYYRVRELGSFAEIDVDGQSFLTSDYESEGRPHRLVVAFVDLDGLPAAARAIAAHAATVAPGESVVADLYAGHPGEPPPHDELAARCHAVLAEVEFPPALRRVVLAVAEPGPRRGMSAVDLLTFRFADGGPPAEDEFLRGLHPMMAERLRLWRFANFSLQRVPSAEDVYLFQSRRPARTPRMSVCSRSPRSAT